MRYAIFKTNLYYFIDTFWDDSYKVYNIDGLIIPEKELIILDGKNNYYDLKEIVKGGLPVKMLFEATKLDELFEATKRDELFILNKSYYTQFRDTFFTKGAYKGSNFNILKNELKTCYSSVPTEMLKSAGINPSEYYLVEVFDLQLPRKTLFKVKKFRDFTKKKIKEKKMNKELLVVAHSKEDETVEVILEIALGWNDKQRETHLMEQASIISETLRTKDITIKDVNIYIVTEASF